MKSIGSSQARQFVANYTHGKQKRTKTGKKEAEEEKDLVAKTSIHPRHASSVRRLAKRGKYCLADYPALTFKTIQAPHPSCFAEDGVLDFVLLTPCPTHGIAHLYLRQAAKPAPARLPAACSTEYAWLALPASWMVPGNSTFLLDNSTPRNDHQMKHIYP